jgi:DNA invertase Pin-like site-specific DNA recombinase
MQVIGYVRPTSGPKGAARRQNSRLNEFVEAGKHRLGGKFTEKAGASRFPQLEKAVKACQDQGAMLVLVRVGRLVKSPLFTSLLSESGIEFVALDDPHFNSNTIQIIRAVAEEKAVRTSEAAKKTMAKLKKKGMPLGSARPGHWDGREHRRGWRQAVKEATKLRIERTEEYYKAVAPRILAWREKGMARAEIAQRLNSEGLTTQAGKPYTEVAVSRVEERARCKQTT